MISLELFRKHIRPRHQRFVDIAKSFGIPTIIHTCGSSSWAYEDFIAMGINGVDTLQPEAANMARVLNYTILSAVTDSRIETKGALQIGVAEFPEDGESLWALLDRADERGERQSYMNKGARA